MTAELLRLAERCEKETAGSRELDALIWAEIDGRDVRWHDNMLLGKSRKPPHDECRIGYIDPGVVNRNFSLAWPQSPIPEYSSSLDAAVSLVPEEMAFGCGSRDATNTSWAWVGKHDGSVCAPDTKIANAATPALALTAACLRALASRDDESRQHD